MRAEYHRHSISDKAWSLLEPLPAEQPIHCGEQLNFPFMRFAKQHPVGVFSLTLPLRCTGLFCDGLRLEKFLIAFTNR